MIGGMGLAPKREFRHRNAFNGLRELPSSHLGSSCVLHARRGLSYTKRQ
jgi:hypothetical protein